MSVNDIEYAFYTYYLEGEEKKMVRKGPHKVVLTRVAAIELAKFMYNNEPKNVGFSVGGDFMDQLTREEKEYVYDEDY